jgi:hypothetical protein
VSASVVLYCVETSDFDANDLRHYLWSFSHVKDLIFSYQGKKLTIENNLQWCPKFFNLVGLTLGKWCLNANFYALIVFLQNSPRLEKLTLILAEVKQFEMYHAYVKAFARVHMPLEDIAYLFSFL